MKRNQIISSAIIISAAVAGTAFATTEIENDAQAVLGAKFSLAQAVSVAEQHVKGRAAAAEFEKSSGKLVYEVEVVVGSKVFDIEVDGMTGQVADVSEDSNDIEKDGGEDESESN